MRKGREAAIRAARCGEKAGPPKRLKDQGRLNTGPNNCQILCGGKGRRERESDARWASSWFVGCGSWFVVCDGGGGGCECGWYMYMWWWWWWWCIAAEI